VAPLSEFILPSAAWLQFLNPIQNVVDAEHHKQALYAECRYTECNYAECRGAFVIV